jgi:hypothetical protein
MAAMPAAVVRTKLRRLMTLMEAHASTRLKSYEAKTEDFTTRGARRRGRTQGNTKSTKRSSVFVSFVCAEGLSCLVPQPLPGLPVFIASCMRPLHFGRRHVFDVRGRSSMNGRMDR